MSNKHEVNLRRLAIKKEILEKLLNDESYEDCQAVAEEVTTLTLKIVWDKYSSPDTTIKTLMECIRHSGPDHRELARVACKDPLIKRYLRDCTDSEEFKEFETSVNREFAPSLDFG